MYDYCVRNLLLAPSQLIVCGDRNSATSAICDQRAIKNPLITCHRGEDQPAVTTQNRRAPEEKNVGLVNTAQTPSVKFILNAGGKPRIAWVELSSLGFWQ
jgi:hypothetical protein